MSYHEAGWGFAVGSAERSGTLDWQTVSLHPCQEGCSVLASEVGTVYSQCVICKHLKYRKSISWMSVQLVGNTQLDIRRCMLLDVIVKL